MHASTRLPRLLLTAALLLAAGGPAAALEQVVTKKDGHESTLEGRVVATAQDGGLLLLGRDGVLWPVQPQELVKKNVDERPFLPFTAEEMSQRMLAELPKGFEVYRTAHYLICYSTTREYAQWCGSLFERLYKAFSNYWTHRGFDLKEPLFPLVAIVFSDRESYIRFAQAELGEAAQSIIGYYSLQTNRMTLYDLTGVEASGRPRKSRGASAQIKQFLARPGAEQIVATVVHEATHQIAYNCGLHARLSDCPLWFSEGIAIYFETPDLSNAKGWRKIGDVNGPRLERFRNYLRQRAPGSLETLISDDKRFRDTSRALDAYAETWSLTYFLINQRPKQYLQYLEMLSRKKPLMWDTPETRLAEFQKIFGNLKKLDTDFLRYMARMQ
jgi:hypothetical protein